MLTQFINNVVVIDDNDADDQKAKVLENLLSFFKTEDIAATHFNPVGLKASSMVFKKNKQLIFLDLHLDNSKDAKRNIQEEIRPLLKKILPADFGNYGIIMWTKYIDDVELLKEKIQEDKLNNKYPTPLFIVGLDKMKYIMAGNFNTLLADVENILKNDTAATFFLEWSNSVRNAQTATLSNIYSLLPDYKRSSDDFTFLLKKLALNYTGIEESQVGSYPLHIDAFKSFDDIMHAELINAQKTGTNPFTTSAAFSNTNDLPNIYARLNAAILIDENNIEQSAAIPGNVYEIIQDNNPFKSDKSTTDAKNIVFEITPPCDFSNSGKRVKARLIGGFLFPIDEELQKKIKEELDKQSEKDPKKQKSLGALIKKYTIDKFECTKECFYSEVYPIMISGLSNPQLLILDFRYFGAEEDANLQDASKYKILFRAKPKLFADVLQKFSAHAARLGLSVIH